MKDMKLIERKNNTNIYYIESEDKYVKQEEGELVELEGEEQGEAILKHIDARVASHRRRVFAAIFICSFSLMVTIGYFVSKRLDYVKEERIEKECNDVGLIEYLRVILKENKTISEENREELCALLTPLAKVDVDMSFIANLSLRLKSYDFSTCSLKENYAISILEDLLAVSDNGFLARELYCYRNSKAPQSTKDYYISMILTYDEEALVKMLNGQSLSSVLRSLGYSKEDFNDLDVLREKVMQNMNKRVLVEFDNYVLLSELFNGDYQITSNIFAEYTKIFIESEQYYFYFKEGENINDEIYKEKIKALVNKERKEIDYKNQDDRFLVYLYANSILTDWYSYLTVEDMLIDGVYNDTSLNIIDKEDVYRYFTTGELNESHLSVVPYLIYSDQYFPLMQELALCFQEEEKEGRLSASFVEEFITYIDNILYDNIELYPLWERVKREGKPIEGFQLKIKAPREYL